MMEKADAGIRETAKKLPDKPGVYRFYDVNGRLIYVGKAKSLRKRVASYFSKKKYESGKTALLVKKIAEIRFMVVDTEYEALLLENNLIKKYQPKYNIQWRDDKSYPFICIKNERFPRVMAVRNPIKDGSEYYGPYASVRLMNVILELCRALSPLRNCTYKLSAANIEQRKFKTCLEYQIGNCLGPCTGLQSETDYMDSVAQVRKVIRGNLSEVIRQLKEEMKRLAGLMEFEKAALLKEKLDLLEKYRAKSTVVNPRIHDVDVFSICSSAGYAYVNYLKVMKGAIVQGHTLEIKKRLDESEEEILPSAIAELRNRFSSTSQELYLPLPLAISMPGTRVHIPQRGEKKKLLQLSERNAFQLMKNRELERSEAAARKPWHRKLLKLKTDLNLPSLPYHIECFDNSNLQGSEAVAACVVFKNARPAKSEYRHFNIKTVSGPDDYASMREVVFRRYKRLLAEGKPLPQLVIIDGGKGQLSAAVSAIKKLGVEERLSVIGIAKRLEEIYRPGDPHPLHIDKKSESLRLIQQLRDEAHRFGISHHRKKRVKKRVTSELNNIRGIGPATVNALLSEFKSVKRVKAASTKAIAAVVGRSKAALIKAHFPG
ncbi:MAG: excinuclease ABC subunit UvrC [Flavobacteriales bacterium]